MTKRFLLVLSALAILSGCSKNPDVVADTPFIPPTEKDLKRTDFPAAVSFSCPEHTQSVYGYHCDSNSIFLQSPEGSDAWQILNCKEEYQFFQVCVDKYEYPGINEIPQRVSLEQAKNACIARDGHLCSVKEWQESCQGNIKSPYGTMSLGRSQDCNFSTPHKGGAKPGCRNVHGVIDMIGNEREWQAEGTTGYSTCVDQVAAAEDDKNSFRCCYNPTSK